MIHILRTRGTRRQLSEMLEALGTYVKLAVDVRREVLAGGGSMHADCERTLLDDGSAQEDVWGADWDPYEQEVSFESLINIRPHQNNLNLEILDPAIRERVRDIARRFLADV